MPKPLPYSIHLWTGCPHVSLAWFCSLYLPRLSRSYLFKHNVMMLIQNTKQYKTMSLSPYPIPSKLVSSQTATQVSLLLNGFITLANRNLQLDRIWDYCSWYHQKTDVSYWSSPQSDFWSFLRIHFPHAETWLALVSCYFQNQENSLSNLEQCIRHYSAMTIELLFTFYMGC